MGASENKAHTAGGSTKGHSVSVCANIVRASGVAWSQQPGAKKLREHRKYPSRPLAHREALEVGLGGGSGGLELAPKLEGLAALHGLAA